MFVVSCSAGMYYHNDSCQLCPKGSYQDKEGQTSCNPCKDSNGHVTGATSLRECTGQ